MILSIEHGRVQELKQSLRSIRCRGGRGGGKCKLPDFPALLLLLLLLN